MLQIALRVLVYLLFAALVAEILHWEARHLPQVRMFSEFGYTEWAQSLVLAATTGLLVHTARTSMEFRQLAVCMALVFLILLIRENDQLLELWLAHGTWKYVAAVPALFGARYFWRHRRRVAAQVKKYARTSSFGMMLGGFMVLGFSRMFGRSDYWLAVMGDDFQRVVKNAAEEGVEFMALGLLLVAAVELAFFQCRPPATED